MTQQKHFKQLVRSRMAKTGESYATARRQVLRTVPQVEPGQAVPWHFPGNIAATTALRILLANAGVRAPHTGEPFSEAMLFGIAGGIGAGMFSFLYEKEDFASFYVAGRHLFQDDTDYLKEACQLLGVKPVIQESAGARAAEKQLRAALANKPPCIAWVDLAHLPHRAMPVAASGGGYHVITVYALNEEEGTALIGDLTDQPISIPLADLAASRARIKKQKHRLLSFPPAASPKELAPLVLAGLRKCHDSLRGKSGKWKQKNFQLEAFRVWAVRMHGSNDKERWDRVFTPGGRLWNGLTAINQYIDHYGTGGGLCRPIFADFLAEAAEALGEPRYGALAERYAEIGRGWSALADAALPDHVPVLRQAKELLARKAEITHGGGQPEEIRSIWKQLGDLGDQVRKEFPLSESECADLRAGLQKRIMALYEAEETALQGVGGTVG
jgi:hypothetical protein